MRLGLFMKRLALDWTLKKTDALNQNQGSSAKKTQRKRSVDIRRFNKKIAYDN